MKNGRVHATRSDMKANSNDAQSKFLGNHQKIWCFLREYAELHPQLTLGNVSIAADSDHKSERNKQTNKPLTIGHINNNVFYGNGITWLEDGTV